MTYTRYLADKPFKLQKAEVFREIFQGKYDGGRQLPMSCGAEKDLSEAARADERAAEAAADDAAKCAPRLHNSMLFCVACIPDVASSHIDLMA